MRVINYIFVLFWVVLTVSPLIGQETESVLNVDARLVNAWAEIKKAEDPDSLRRVYGDEFFQYYLGHTQAKDGKEAIVAAFTMWANAGAADQLVEAVTQIDKSSAIWTSILSYVDNAFINAGRDRNDYMPLLHKLAKQLTHAGSKAEALRNLGKNYQKAGKVSKAIKYYRMILDLPVDSFYVNYAEGSIYEIKNLSVGKQAPTFTVQTVKGKTVDLAALEGQVILLDFWATWCGPCLEAIPTHKKIARKYTGQDFKLISVSLDYKKDDLLTFIKKHDIKWPQIWQEKVWQGSVAVLYNVKAIPDSYLINRKGEIVAKGLRGEALIQDIEKAVDKLMNKQK